MLGLADVIAGEKWHEGEIEETELVFLAFTGGGTDGDIRLDIDRCQRQGNRGGEIPSSGLGAPDVGEGEIGEGDLCVQAEGKVVADGGDETSANVRVIVDFADADDEARIGRNHAGEGIDLRAGYGAAHGAFHRESGWSASEGDSQGGEEEFRVHVWCVSGFEMFQGAGGVYGSGVPGRMGG